MIDLSEPKGNFEIPIFAETTVTVRPFTTDVMVAAQTAAQARVREIIEPYEKCKAEGLIPDSAENLNLDDTAVVEGMRVKFLIEELAVRLIVSWEGVSYKGKPAPLDPRMIAALMGQNPVGQTFFHELTLRQVERLIAKKDGGADATGTLAAAPNTAEGAKKTMPHVQGENQQKAESSVPTKSTDSDQSKKPLLGGFLAYWLGR